MIKSVLNICDIVCISSLKTQNNESFNWLEGSVDHCTPVYTTADGRAMASNSNKTQLSQFHITRASWGTKTDVLDRLWPWCPLLHSHLVVHWFVHVTGLFVFAHYGLQCLKNSNHWQKAPQCSSLFLLEQKWSVNGANTWRVVGHQSPAHLWNVFWLQNRSSTSRR